MTMPRRSAAVSSSRAAVCQCGFSCSTFGRAMTYSAASRGVISSRPSSSTIGASNSFYQDNRKIPLLKSSPCPLRFEEGSQISLVCCEPRHAALNLRMQSARSLPCPSLSRLAIGTAQSMPQCHPSNCTPIEPISTASPSSFQDDEILSCACAGNEHYCDPRNTTKTLHVAFRAGEGRPHQ
jgi:hypothetical protein